MLVVRLDGEVPHGWKPQGRGCCLFPTARSRVDAVCVFFPTAGSRRDDVVVFFPTAGSRRDDVVVFFPTAGSRGDDVVVCFPRLEAVWTRFVFFFPRLKAAGTGLDSMVLFCAQVRPRNAFFARKSVGFYEPVTHIFFCQKIRRIL